MLLLIDGSTQSISKQRVVFFKYVSLSHLAAYQGIPLFVLYNTNMILHNLPINNKPIAELFLLLFKVKQRCCDLLGLNTVFRLSGIQTHRQIER